MQAPSYLQTPWTQGWLSEYIPLGLRPDASQRPTYQGRPVLGLHDPRTAPYQRFLHDPAQQADRKSPLACGLYLAVVYAGGRRTCLMEMPRHAFLCGETTHSATLYARDTMVLHLTEEYARFGIVREHYADRYILGIYDPQGLSRISLELFSQEPLPCRKCSEADYAFLIVRRDADGDIESVEMLPLAVFIRLPAIQQMVQQAVLQYRVEG